MLVILHSNIEPNRGMLTYAIVMHLNVDMDRVINKEMKAVADVESNRALGFPVLITQLCHLTRVDISSGYFTNAIKL